MNIFKDRETYCHHFLDLLQMYPISKTLEKVNSQDQINFLHSNFEIQDDYCIKIELKGTFMQENYFQVWIRSNFHESINCLKIQNLEGVENERLFVKITLNETPAFSSWGHNQIKNFKIKELVFATADLDDVSLKWIIGGVKPLEINRRIWRNCKLYPNPVYIQVEKPLNEDEKGIMNHRMKELNESQQDAFEKAIKYSFSLCQG